MRVIIAIAIFAAAWASGSAAQTYSVNGLSTDDVLTIGRALDKLLGSDPADRAYTDRSRLVDRIQAQITQQSNAMAKARADAEKAAFDKAVADAIEKSKETPP